MVGTEQFILGDGRRHGGMLQVGLLNNMPDAHLRATELQFARLLKDAAGGLDVRLRLFSFGAIARSHDVKARMQGFYDDAAFLQDANMDALIVTGDAPDVADMRGRPYWQDLAGLIDWAQTGTLSTLFSGAAVQAAAWQLDDIASNRLAQPLSGVFATERAEDDTLFFHTAWNFRVPHLRSHAIALDDLSARGYRMLSRLSDGSANIFTRETPGQSRLVFVQGHPEYDEGALGRDYLNAMAQYLHGDAAQRPAVPQHYFDRATEVRLAEIVGADAAALPLFTQIVQQALPLQSWRSDAVRVFANWLTLVASAKMRRASSRSVHTRKRAS